MWHEGLWRRQVRGSLFQPKCVIWSYGTKRLSSPSVTLQLLCMQVSAAHVVQGTQERAKR